MNLFQGIIDLYDENDRIDFDDAWDRGVRAILHETSMGLYKKDKAYAARKAKALDMGFLWAGYHLVSAQDIKAQLEFVLAIEDCSDPRVGLAIDWEKTSKGTATGAQIRDFVRRFNQAMKPRYPDRYPILYGGNLVREDSQIKAGDPLLAKCPLWYVRMTNGALQIPAKTWPSYTLWQFDDEKRKYGGPPPKVLPGADWSRFQGTEAELRAAWPFGGTGGGGTLPLHPLEGTVIDAVAPPIEGFGGRAVSIALQEWDFWGKQTYDLVGHATRVGEKEGQDGWYQRVGSYWEDGVLLTGIDGRNHDWAWSAAFISWAMRSAGAGTGFRYSRQHSVYISQAIRDKLQGNEAAGYWGVRLNEEKPALGDIVCWSRQAGIDYEHQHGGDYLGHCDIVVEVRPSEVDVVGGNVGDSVTRRPLSLAQQFLKPTIENGETLFALMKNRIA
jgi:hypothetical protein